MKKPFYNFLKFYRNLPIRSKLVLVLYVQILVPLIIVGYLSYKNSEGIIKEKSTDYSRDILKMIQLSLTDYINNLTIISQDLLYDSKIYNVLKTDKSEADRLSTYEYENEINSLLKKVVLSRTEILSICLVTNSGTYYYADNNSKNVSIRRILPYEKVLESARNSEGKPAWYIESEGRRVDNIYLARTVYDRDNYKENGLLVLLVNKELLESVYEGLTSNMKNIAIVSGENQRIASRDGNDADIFSDELLESFREDKGEKIDEKAGIFVSYVTLKDPDWKVVAYVTLDELYRDAYALRRNIIMLCIISILLLSVLNAFIAIDFVDPINRLVKGMKKVQKGDGNVYIEEDRKDELGFLNKTFNEMSRDINHLVHWVYREQLTRKEAELKALQSQINPHFLFNTLEAINWMAHLNNVPEISSTVSDLSDLMEASIGRDDRLITVEEEFTYVDKYISLLKRRFEDRLELLRNVREDVLGIKIPRLLIQPLIENAVYHGLEKSRSRGVITLNAAQSMGILTIEVIDNGTGMGSAELESLNEKLSMDNNTYFKTLGESKSRGIGIENVNRRIKLFYGEDYGLKIESEAGRYTKVTIVVPADNAAVGEGFYVQGIDHRR